MKNKAINFEENSIIENKYYFYYFNEENYWIFEICFTLYKWLYIRAIQIDWDNLIINYKNIEWEEVQKFLQKVNNHCYILIEQEFKTKWENCTTWISKELIDLKKDFKFQITKH